MNKLMLNELVCSGPIDCKTMAQVRGGWTMFSPSCNNGSNGSYDPGADSLIHPGGVFVQPAYVVRPDSCDSMVRDLVVARNSVFQPGERTVVGL